MRIQDIHDEKYSYYIHIHYLFVNPGSSHIIVLTTTQDNIHIPGFYNNKVQPPKRLLILTKVRR